MVFVIESHVAVMALNVNFKFDLAHDGRIDMFVHYLFILFRLLYNDTIIVALITGSLVKRKG